MNALDDKQNGVADAAETLSPAGLTLDPVDVMVCTGCQAEIETAEIPALVQIQCPSCGVTLTVPGMIGAYRVLELIGTGGMGAVYLAQDDGLKRKVAIKLMSASMGEDDAALEAFRKEAQSAAQLNHSNVCQVYAFGEEKGHPYLVMELVNGDVLSAMIADKVVLEPGFVMRVGMEIAEGLDAAATVNMVHGDIKPENILFDENFQAKLVDFGIAGMVDAKSAAGEVWGTPYYIAPEKVKKHKADVRSDIYSLGATLYHALAGKPPYDGADATEVVKARFERPAESLGDVRPGLDPKVVEIIKRMMQNDLFLRYPKYGSLLTDIREYLDKEIGRAHV